MNATPLSAPTHHLHISTEFALIVGIMLLAALGIVAWLVFEMRKPKRQAERPFSPPRPPSPRATFQPRPVTPSTPGASEYRSAPYSYTGVSAPRVPDPPAPPSPPVAPSSSMSAGTGFLAGLAGGMLLDGALRDEPSYIPPPIYDPPPSSSDSGMTYDSGPDAGRSGGDSSGGFTVDW